MLDVIFTVDVELWGDGRRLIEDDLQTQYDRYILGKTPAGDFGLPRQFEILNDHGLRGVYFVEPLFATCFHEQHLADIIGLVNEGRQEVQLHLHTEWVHRARTPLLLDGHVYRQNLRNFSMDEQRVLLALGKQLLLRNGAGSVEAFRAGNFGFNKDTLTALAANGIAFDSSYNATLFGPDCGVMPGTAVIQPVQCEGVFEYPVTVFRDGRGALRHLQVTACSSGEMETILWQSLESGCTACVIVFHSFELLDSKLLRPDKVVIRRFRKLCAFLDRHRDVFNVTGFKGLQPRPVVMQPSPHKAGFVHTAVRLVEQVSRRLRA